MTARRLLAAALAVAVGGGCATTWATSQLAGGARIWDEQVREEVVPLPGVDERLIVALPLAIEHEAAPATTTAASAPAVPPRALPFALTCTAEQRAQDEVYHSAFRYGARWKKTTAIMFAVEGLAASAFLFLGERTVPNQVYGGFFAIDAVATAALFFVPRQEIYRRDVRPVTTPLRRDCPAAMTLTIGTDVFPVDAAGRLGELGDTALDDWMQAPRGAVYVTYAGQRADLVLGNAEQCAWHRHRQRPPGPGCAYPGSLPPRVAVTTLTVAPGTLTRAE